MRPYGDGTPLMDQGAYPRPLPAPVACLEAVADATGLLPRALPAHQRALQRRRQAPRTDLPTGAEPAAARTWFHRRAQHRRERRAVRRVHGPGGQPPRRTGAGGGGCRARPAGLGARTRRPGLGRGTGRRRQLADAAQRAVHVASSAGGRRQRPAVPGQLRQGHHPGGEARGAATAPAEHVPLPPAVQHAGRYWTIWIATLAAVLLGIPPALKLVRRRRRRGATPASARFVGGWADVLDRVRDLGQEVPDGLSRTEQARRLGLTLELARSADLHVFGRAEPRAEDAATFWRGVTEERRRLGREAGALRRFVAIWAPWSLLESLRAARRRWRRGGSRGRRWRAVRPAPEG